MPRIAEKELVVNLQMKMQMKCSCPQLPLYVYNPGWGSESIDPVTGKAAKFYDYVPRNIKAVYLGCKPRTQNTGRRH